MLRLSEEWLHHHAWGVRGEDLKIIEVAGNDQAAASRQRDRDHRGVDMMFGTHVGLGEQASDVACQSLISRRYGDIAVGAKSGIDGLLLALSSVKLSQNGRRNDNIPSVVTGRC